MSSFASGVTTASSMPKASSTEVKALPLSFGAKASTPGVKSFGEGSSPFGGMKLEVKRRAQKRCHWNVCNKNGEIKRCAS